MTPGFTIITQRLRAKDEKTLLGKTTRKAPAGTVMASVWWDSQGMIKKDYFEHGKTVTGNTSVQQIKNPRKAIKSKRRHKLTSCVLLMQDNAPSQNSDVISRVWL